ncbi:MAG: NUDIX domain-containing protein [Aeropyrum sp.]|nr:NUDIX domain-containing protein [Aeropyrum sp.]MCE4616460.1 NUDIX domain-containing protein [Aeropyrum sp.]
MGEGEPDSAVLALLWGRPARILMVRKRCQPGYPWACDLALPGGRIEEGEEAWETAVREAWEEAWIHPKSVEVVGGYCCESTLARPRRIEVVIAVLAGPAEPKPSGGEVDAAIWLKLSLLSRSPRPVHHPIAGRVLGYKLGGGLTLWGATMRIARRLLALIQSGEPWSVKR